MSGTSGAARKSSSLLLILLISSSANVEGFQVRSKLGARGCVDQTCGRVALFPDVGMRRQSYHWLGVLMAANDGDSESRETGSVPFFARMAKKFTEMGTDAISQDEAASKLAEEGGIAIAVESKDEQTENTKSPKSATDIATELKIQAEKARLEAEKMDAMLTLEKISKLENQLDNKTLKAEEEKEIRQRIEVLTNKLSGPKESKVSSSTSSAAASDLDKKVPSSSVISAEEKDGTSSIDDEIPPISEKELMERTEAFLRSPKVLQQMTAKAAGFSDDRNATAIIEQMYKDEQLQILKKKKRDAGDIEPLDEEALEKALEGYMQLPLPIQDMIARSAGLESGRNATAVITKLADEGRLFSAEDGLEGGFEIDTDVVDTSDINIVFEEMEGLEKARYIEAMLPEETRKVPVPDEDMDVFFSKVLSKKNFNPTGKPENIPGGFLIRGENKMKSGDELVAAIDEALMRTNISDRVQFYYMKDPSPVTQEEFENDEAELPVLVVTGRDVSPTTNKLVKPIVSALGILFIASFSLGTLSFNEVLVDRLDAELQSGAADLTWIKDLASPLFLSLCLTQLVHEAAHQIVALRDKFKAGPPTIVPSFQMGLTGAITPLETPPPNLNSLFDFSMAGPLSGMIVSLFLMYSGLQQTAFMDPAAQAQLPSLPMDLIRSSSLAGGMVEWLLGDGILLSPNPASATVLLHPFAIAGFVGLVSNALSLLPIGNTDGGRIFQTLFGRNWCRVVSGFTLLFLVCSGLFGLDDANLLLTYAAFTSLWQRDPEIPCQNEVDDLDLGRAVVASVGLVLVGLTLIPMP